MIRQDLILHFLAGYMIASLCQFAGAWMMLIALVAGIGKEVYDIRKTGFDWKDILLTVTGGFMAYFITLIY